MASPAIRRLGGTDAREADAEVGRVLRRLRRAGRRHRRRREAAPGRCSTTSRRRHARSQAHQGRGAPGRRSHPPRLRAAAPAVHHPVRPRGDPPPARPHRRRAGPDRRRRGAAAALRDRTRACRTPTELARRAGAVHARRCRRRWPRCGSSRSRSRSSPPAGDQARWRTRPTQLLRAGARPALQERRGHAHASSSGRRSTTCIETATDRCEDVANVIEGVVLEHA